MILRKLYCFFVMVFISSCLFANKDSSLTISEKQWDKVTKDKNYIETFTDFEPEEKENKKTNFKAPSLDLGGLKYVFYILVAGAILFVVIKILQNINSSPSISNDNGRIYTLQEVEEKILEIDLNKILNDALSAQDYRLALRIHFLIIIKALSLKGKITWAKDKTNWEYYNEIKDENIAFKFKEIIVPFEVIWYGEHELNENQYNKLQPPYNSFKIQLGVNE